MIVIFYHDYDLLLHKIKNNLGSRWCDNGMDRIFKMFSHNMTYRIYVCFLIINSNQLIQFNI